MTAHTSATATAKLITDKVEEQLISLLDSGMIEIGGFKQFRRKNKNEVQSVLQAETQKKENILIRRQLINQQLKLFDPKANSLEKSRSKDKKKPENQSLIQQQEEPSKNQLSTPQLVLSKQQHKEVITKLERLREDSQKRQQIIIRKKQQQILKEQQQRRQREQEQKELTAIQKRQKLQQSLKQQKQIHESMMKEVAEGTKRFKQVQKKKHVYQEIQERYVKQIKLPTIEEGKQKIELRRKQLQNYTIDAIRMHEKTYLKEKERSMSSIKVASEEPKIVYRPPAKSQRLVALLQQEETAKRLEKQVKQKELHDKLERAESYVNYLKQRFVPRVDPKKREEIELRVTDTGRRQPRDMKSLGARYMEEAKKITRKSRIIITPGQSNKQNHEQISNNQSGIQSEQREGFKSVSAKKGQQRRWRDKNNIGQQDSTSLNHNEFAQIQEETENNRKVTPKSYQEQKHQRVPLVPQLTQLSTHSNPVVDSEMHRRKLLSKITHDPNLGQADKVMKIRIEQEKITQLSQQKEKLLKVQRSQRLEDQTVQLLISSVRAKVQLMNLYKK